MVYKTKIAYLLLPYLLIISLIASCIEIDIVVPGFPAMANHFNTTEEAIQWILSINFLGVFVASLLYGPLSEAYGRRTIMLFGNVLFTMGGIGCVFANTLLTLIICRFFQGIGASATCVIAFVMIADVYQGERATKVIGLMNGFLTAILALAPVIGSFVCNSFGWRANYIVIAMISFVATLLLILYLPETSKNFKKLDMRSIASDYTRLMTNIKFIKYALVPSILSIGHMAWISSSAFLYVNELQMSLPAFAFHQGSVVASFAIASLFVGRIQNVFGTQKSVLYSLYLLFFSGFGLVCLGLYLPCQPILITFCMNLFALSCAVIYGVIFAASFEIIPELKGTASAFMMALRMLLCAVGATLAGKFYDGTLLPISLIIFGSIIVSSIISKSMFTGLTVKWQKNKQLV